MPDLLERAHAALGDRYRLDRELGRGGMATVFLAEDLKHQRPVAIKILHPDVASSIGADRFRREIEFAAHLNHPHILPLIDSGEDGELLWYAMPYVEGESLRQRLERMGQLSLAEAAEIARQTATALDYAHSRGVLHRDIKPENLLLAHGHVWVADFGIARALRRSESTEATGMFAVGTPAYMSPEQGRGDDDLDGRSDIYSLATVIYEALTGTAPFKGDTPEKIFTRRALNPPPPLRSVRTDLPAAAEAAVHRALALEPQDRQATAADFATELTGAVPSPQVAQAVRRASWRTLVAAAAALGAAGLAYRYFTRPPAYDDNRVLILPSMLRDPATRAFGVDLANALETQLGSTAFLLPTPGSVVGAMGPAVADSTIDRLRATHRMRYTIATKIIQDDSLRLSVTIRDAARAGSLPEVVLPALPITTSAWNASVAVARAILPILLPTGGKADPVLVGSRNVEALAQFLVGERAYREGRFATADTLFTLALAADSTFAWAALRGAQAASWNTEHDRALELIRRAEPFLPALGPRVTAFAQGLKAYQEGRADAAVARLTEALGFDPQWSEAWMALAEVYHHLLPRGGSPIDRAVGAMDSARKYDPGFAPPVFHQFQHAVWDRRVADAESLYAVLERSHSPSLVVSRANLTLNACLRGRGSPAWEKAAREQLRTLREAAMDLATGGLEQSACAAAALSAALETDTSATWPPYIRSALAHVLAARGRADSAAMLLADSALGGQGETLAIMFAIAGLPLGRAVDSVSLRIATEELTPGLPHLPSTARLRRLWALGTWEIHRNRWGPAQISETLLRNVAEADSVRPSLRRSARLFQGSLRARRLLAAGDSSGALAALDSLVPTGRQVDLRWLPWEALAHEQFLRAQLLESAGRPREAFAAAEAFDSPASFGLLLYLPQSLEMRIRLAGKLGMEAYQRRLEARLAALRGRDTTQ